MNYETLRLLVSTVEVVSKYFKEGSPAYNCLQASMKEMVKQEYKTPIEPEPLEVNRNIKFPPTAGQMYC